MKPLPVVSPAVRQAATASLIGLLALAATPAMAQDSPQDSTPHSNSVGAAITDTSITAQVKAKLLGDSRLGKSQISVTTTNGVVTLSGTASSADASKAAESAAQAVDGVKSVDNQIQSPSAADTAASKVDHAAKSTGKAVSDTWITTKVKSQLLTDSAAKQADVSVKTSNGVVALSGTAPSQDVVDHIKDLAQQVHGVKSVDVSGIKTQ
jgi:hyperosmotically inducible periplasmic protein